jgi:hypothetical protein
MYSAKYVPPPYILYAGEIFSHIFRPPLKAAGGDGIYFLLLVFCIKSRGGHRPPLQYSFDY